MIEIPTTLVLGAGASMDYRYPSGVDLRLEIIASLHDGDDLIEALRCSDFNPRQIGKFRERLRGSPGIKSVDKFLERNPDLLEVARHSLEAGSKGRARRTSETRRLVHLPLGSD